MYGCVALSTSCIGNYGNVLDGRNQPVKSAAAETADAGDDEAPLMAEDEDKDEEKDAMDEEWHSVTEPAQPLTNDRSSSLFTASLLLTSVIVCPVR